MSNFHMVITMIINGNRIIFKSLREHFYKERVGIKPNIVRILNKKEHCYIQSKLRKLITIQIKEVNTDRDFVRNLDDITIFKPNQLKKDFYIYIFSWIHG